MSGGALAGRRALVTGAARRLGRAIALALADAGADVAVHHRSREAEARETARAIEQRGRRCLLVQADLADAAQAQRAVDAVTSAWDGIDVLVNNASAIVWKDLDAITPQEWRTSLAGTLDCTWYTCRAALPAMREAGGGRIVNILDADADVPGPLVHATPYKIGKSGSWLLTRSLAVSEAPHGITVNAVSPGVLEESDVHPPLARIPAGRLGRAADVTGAVLYLVGTDAAYVTGTNIKVSGGYLV